MLRSKNVKIQNLTKTFKTDKGILEAVKNISLDIEPGEMVCLLGPSGCGKTTTLRMIAGFEIPDSGHIFIGEQDVAHLNPNKRDTAMVFQNYALFPHMNVYDNISYGLKVHKIPKDEIDARVLKILESMKMEDLAQRSPSQMSGGQQQRVSLARALIMNSSVLLFDEPLSNLDAKLRIHMRDEIRRMQQTIGTTSIYVTHDQEEAMALSDKIVIMRDGIIEQVGSPTEIYQNPDNEFVAKFIGRANVLPTKIISNKDGEIKIFLLGAEYSIVEQGNFSSGDEVSVVVRPEAILLDEREGRAKHSAKVSKSVFMGSSHEYEVEIGGIQMELSLTDPHGKSIKRVGEALDFSLNTNSMHILSA